jgi:hypothetical protein
VVASTSSLGGCESIADLTAPRVVDAEAGVDEAGVPSVPPGKIRLASPQVTSPFIRLGSSAPSTTATTTVVAGDLLVVAVAWTYGSLLNAASAMTVSDSLGNSWQSATSVYNNYLMGAGSHCKADAQIFYAVNVKGGSDVVTLTTNQPGNTYFGFTLLEYSGIATTRPLDAFGGQATPPGGSNLVASPSLAVTAAKDLIVAVFADTAGGGLMSAGPGFTLRGSDTSLYAMMEDNLPGLGPDNHVATATLPNGATDNCWAVATAAFRSP